MNVSDISWHEIKQDYKQNLQSLQKSVNETQNSTLSMNRIYSKVMKKAHNTSPQTLKKFAELWSKNMDFENLESSSLLKNDFQNLIYGSTQKDFENFGLSLQQQVYRKSITGLDDYRITMEAFFNTWDKIWPN